MKEFLSKDISVILSTQDCSDACREDAKIYIRLPDICSKYRNDYREHCAALKAYTKARKAEEVKKRELVKSGRKDKSILNKRVSSLAPYRTPGWVKPYEDALASYKAEINQYVEHNYIQYTLCINTWLMLLRTYSPLMEAYISDLIKRRGFAHAVLLCKDVSTLLFAGKPIPSEFQHFLLDMETRGCTTLRDVVPYLRSDDVITTFITMLRFPSRFSPCKNPGLVEDTIKEFQDIQLELKRHDRHMSQFWLNELRLVISELMPWKAIVREIKKLKPSDFMLISTGSSPVGKSLDSKLEQLDAQWPTALHTIYGYHQPCCDSGPASFSFIRNAMWFNRLDKFKGGLESLVGLPVPLVCVPKSFGKLRLITPDFPSRYGPAKAVCNVLDKYMPKSIPIHDQSVNGELAFAGSIDDSWATIDSSHASDRLGKYLFRSIFPPDFVRIVENFMPQRYTTLEELKQARSLYIRSKVLYTFSTAGNPLTFHLESVMFLGIAALAIWVTNPSLSLSQCLEMVRVYGDDIVVPPDYFQPVCDMLGIFGIKVNTEKSFCDGAFRESCGIDALDGTIVTSVYWPRKAFDLCKIKDLDSNLWRDSDETTSALSTGIDSIVALQHRIYDISPMASDFLQKVIHLVDKDYGVSLPGENDKALWGYSPLYKLVDPPYAEGSIPSIEGKIKVYRVRTVTNTGISTPYVERYLYHEYLAKGPLFTDDLLRTLGVTTSRRDMLMIDPSVEVTYQR